MTVYLASALAPCESASHAILHEIARLSRHQDRAFSRWSVLTKELTHQLSSSNGRTDGNYVALVEDSIETTGRALSGEEECIPRAPLKHLRQTAQDDNYIVQHEGLSEIHGSTSEASSSTSQSLKPLIEGTPMFS